MSKIPTAEEFFKKLQGNLEDYDEGGYLGLNEKEGAKMLIEFAKLHVQEALRCASEDARCDWYDHDEISNEKLYRVEKDTILSAYPLTNIK